MKKLIKSSSLSTRVCASFLTVFVCLQVFNLLESSGIVQEEKNETKSNTVKQGEKSKAKSKKDKQEDFTEKQIEFFETKVRPLLVEHCYDCHGPDSEPPEGGLSLASREAIIEGGDSGAAIDLVEPEKSHIIDAVNYADLFEMPPDSKLPQKEIDIITKWVKMGAPWPKSKSSQKDKEGNSVAETFDIKKKSCATLVLASFCKTGNSQNEKFYVGARRN